MLLRKNNGSAVVLFELAGKGNRFAVRDSLIWPRKDHYMIAEEFCIHFIMMQKK